MREYDLKLNAAELDLVLRALGELPLKLVIHVFAKLNEQKIEQDKPVE